MSDVTRILSAIEQGDPHAAGELLPLVYGELRKLATQKLAQLGSWILDPQGGALFCSDEATRIFGFVPGAGAPGLPALLARVPDDERTAVQHHIEAGLSPRDATIKAMDQVAGPGFPVRSQKPASASSRVMVLPSRRKSCFQYAGF